jgi:hypothetical protein
MPLWLILGAVGIGGYLLLSKSASASSNVASAQAQANAAMAQSIAANPSGLAPGFQGQATGPYTPATPATPPYDPGLGSVQQGGQVYDPNLGGTPDINSLLSGMQPGFQGATAAGTVGRRR